jgi:hypothetical protein
VAIEATQASQGAHPETELQDMFSGTEVRIHCGLKIAQRGNMTNDQIILGQVLDQRKQDLAPSLSDADYFEVFVAEQVLKDNDLSYEEIEDGIVGDGGDGGVDALYVFANGDLVREDSDVSSLKRGVMLEVVVIQAKRSPSFGESAIDKLQAMFVDLLDLSHHVDDYKSVYNDGVRDAVARFRSIYGELASRFPSVKFRIVYGSTGTEVHPNVVRKGELLKTKINDLYSLAEASVEFLGAPQLLGLARRIPSTSFTLALAETPISAAGDVGFIALVKLRDYFSFITDDAGRLRKSMFEANVRDYQGATQVNEEIRRTLGVSGREDFWWLNNGVTIVASRAAQSSKAITMEDPQVVNGLQTSTEIYKHFEHPGVGAEDGRHLLVRVIVPSADDSRDRVIKATNSQTYVPPASLRATDKIQRDIEEFLKSFGIYYDRRKNFYKNDGKPLEKIVGISLMAQAVMAVLLQRPDTARARPSSLLKDNADYDSVFDEKRDIHVYRICIALLRRSEGYIRTNVPEAKDRNNTRFYVAARLACVLTGRFTPTAAQLCAIDVDAVTDAQVKLAFDVVLEKYQALGASDQVAKGPELRVAVCGVPL